MDNSDSTKFKADPYNPNNKLITKDDILTIMKSLNIQDFKIHNLSLYQHSYNFRQLNQAGRNLG